MTELNLCLPEAYHTRPRRLIFELRVTDKNQFKKREVKGLDKIKEKFNGDLERMKDCKYCDLDI